MRYCPSSRWWLFSLALAVGFAVVRLPAQQIVTGTNVNMVSGTTYPAGDPFLQRQNEPSSAVSTRNHSIFSAARTIPPVDIPFSLGQRVRHSSPAAPERDAWVGVFKSLAVYRPGKSTLVPGYPQDGPSRVLSHH